jgi:hypothetical protein
LSVRDPIASIVGNIPHRMALAGGWIDQPFVSRHNPSPPDSMVVVSLEPNLWFMDRWLEEVIHFVPIGQRPEGYNPLGIKNLDPEWIRQLGQTGKDCFDAIAAKDIRGLAASMNRCMACWEAILPQTVEHPTIRIDLKRILSYYQQRYAGAMYSGCGGGYAIVASEEPVPGALKVKVKTC